VDLRTIAFPAAATGAFLFLGAIFAVTVPLYEAPDEPKHIALTGHVAETGSWPRQVPGVFTPWQQEGSQPPLYYRAMAGLTRLFSWPVDGLGTLFRPNPFARPGDLTADVNKNVALHGPGEAFPWQGPTLTVRLWRLTSVVIAAAAVPAVYGLGRTLFPDRPAWAAGATLLITFNPAFIFNMSRVSNDALAVPLTALGFWLLARAWTAKDQPAYRFGLAGVATGLAALTKLSGLVLLPAGLAALLDRAVRHRQSLKATALCLILFLGPPALLAGWWFWQNLGLYGDPTGLNVMVEIAGRRQGTPNFLAEVRGTIWSYWALFGWMNIGPEPAALHLLEGLTVLGLVGACGLTVASLIRRNPELFSRLAGLWVCLGLEAAAFIRWTALTPASDGRLLYPAAGPIAVLLWAGWEALTARWRLTRPLPWLLVGALGVLAVVAPFRYILPAYAGPEPVQAVPADARPVNVTFGGRLRLLAYEPGKAEPGEPLRVTFYWECLGPTPEPWALFIHQVGNAAGAAVPNVDTFPGRGIMSTADCVPGYRFADRYALPVRGVPEGAAVVRLRVGLRVPPVGGEPVPVTGPSGEPLDALVIEAGKVRGRVGVARRTEGPAVGPLRLLASEVAGQARAGGVLTVVTVWEVLSPTDADWRVFVHLGDPDRPPLAQSDGPPAAGNFPARWWEPGDTFVDRREIRLPQDLPPGRYPVTAGLYTPGGIRADVAGSGLTYIYLGEVEIPGN
jgi:4-amino-4-deoxy-L-arabinose transferase-like glycosyltransferase